MTDTKFAEGNYNFVRLYQKEVVIDGCTFNENMKVDLAVNGATATVTKCTVENGNVEDLFYDADIVNSTITVDGVKLVRVAKIGNTYYKTFAGALTAAADGATVELLWNEGDAPIAMNGSITGNKTVTITGTATVDWSKGWLFVGYADGSNAKLIFNNATLTSTEASLKNGSYGIHVYMAKAGGSRGNGEVEFKNSTIDLSYLMGKNTVTVDGGKLTVWYGFAVGARPVSETGEQKTATMTVKNGATVEVKNHNGMGIGYESNGILYIDNATVSVTGLTVKDGSSVVLTAVDATLTAPEGLNVTTTVDGYKVVYENGAYSLAEATYIAQIGDKYYESFTEIVDAVKALSEAGTDVVVKFLTDAEITDYKAFDYGTGNITFTADKPVTITIKTDFDFAEANPIVIKVEENVTLKVYDNINGMYVYYAPSLVIEGSVTGGQNWGCLYLAYGEHTVAESGKVEIARLHLAWTDLTVYGMINNKYVLIEESDLTLGGANVTTGFFTDTNNGGLRYGESNINVINGTVVNADAVTLAHKDTILTVDKDSTFTIGNTLTNSGTINIAGKVIVNGTATNNGAIVLTAVDATLTAPEGLNVTTTVDGYEVKYANGTYSLAESAKVAEVNGVQYATLQEALNNANGATVTLLANINENVTVSKNLTIDGAKSETEKYTYTGTMTVNTDLTVTIQNVNFVKGCIAEVAGSHGNLTVKNCTFDGVDNSIGYAITVRGGDKLVIENSTAKNYSTGMLYVPSSVATISVKGVEVSDVAAAFNITYSGDATFEDVEFENVTYGIHFQIHTNGSRTYTVKNSNLSGATNPFWFWDKSNGTDKVTVVFEGENTVPTFQSTIAGYLKLAAGATLTAPAGYDVTTDVTGYVVKYEDGKYQLEKALSGSGTETDPYLITNLDELILFRDSVNAGETKYNATGVYVVLTADIDMLGENWTPIGNTTYNGKYAPVDTSKVFSGTFDGNDKVISNLTISKTVGGVDTQANVGLFGITGAGAVIKDLTINNVTINTDGRNVGALAGYTYGATLENITVNGNIQIKGGNNVSAVGGMSRYSAVTAKNITVSGNNGSTITGNNIVGGIFAEIAPNGSEHSISGLTVKNVAINGVGGVGGIVGLLTEGTVSNVSVKNVVLTGRTDYQGDAMGRIRLGSVAGLLGGKYSTISNATVENVTAKNIDGNAVVLPIIGANYEATSNATEAKIGDTYYATFAVALAAAKADDEIELLDNATVEGTVAIPAGVTIKSNGHTINGSIRMLGDLTLNGPLTITGGLWVGKSGETLTATLSGDKLTASYFMFQHGTYTINADIDAVYGYLSFEGTFEVNSTIHTTGANGEVLYINGNVTLNNGAVLDSDNSVFLCNDAAVLTMKPGSKVDSKLSITKSGAKLVIDATGLTAGEYTGITGTVTNNGNGTIEVINNDTLTAEIKNGKIVLVEKVEEKFDLFGANVNLGNNLNMKFAFAKSHVADWSGHYVEIVKNYADGTADRIEKYYFDDNQWTADGNYYVVTFTGIAAKEMTDRITVTVYDADGNAVSNPWVDSMREYAIRMLEKSSSDLQKQTIVDMLNYGAAAQTNFNYGTSDLANSTLTDEQKAYATTEVDITLNNYAKGAHYFGSNLRLTSNILFRIAFKNLSADMKAVVTFTNHKNEVISVEKNLVLDNGYYVVEIEELVVADIRQKITVSIYDGNTLVETTEESIEEYFARRIDAGTTSSAVEEAFTKFALSAKEYLK